MPNLADLGLASASAWCFVLTFVSAVCPWVNAELIVMSLPFVAHSRAGLVWLVLVATAGQMGGKCLVYWGGRGSARLPSPRLAAAIVRWRDRLGHSAHPLGFVLVSSAVGVPPFLVITALWGALGLAFRPFFVVGTIGRLLRFSAIVVGQAVAMQAGALWR